MKLLLDANLSPALVESLTQAGYVANLPTVSDDLESGAVVSLSPTRLAVRDLPIT